jgi:putative flippase GtrA
MAHLIADSIARIRGMVPELAKFGVVGATGSVVDLGGSALLYGTFHLGPITSKGIALSAACVVTYLGSRFWTFRHRENQPVLRELFLFIVLNAVGLVIAEAVIAITAYAFGARDQLAYNGASIVGTGLGTIFRFWAYRKWVFLAPATASPATAPPARRELNLGKYVSPDSVPPPNGRLAQPNGHPAKAGTGRHRKTR